jgi:hypothetical protein
LRMIAKIPAITRTTATIHNTVASVTMVLPTVVALGWIVPTWNAFHTISREGPVAFTRPVPGRRCGDRVATGRTPVNPAQEDLIPGWPQYRLSASRSRIEVRDHHRKVWHRIGLLRPRGARAAGRGARRPMSPICIFLDEV